MKVKKSRLLGLLVCGMIGFGFMPAKAFAADIAINATNFPDSVFRSYVSQKFDTNKDSTLSDTERNDVQEIDVHGKSVTNLKGIEYFGNLIYLYCYQNNLSSLDVSKNVQLTRLNCQSNHLSSLDVSKNVQLTSLDCQSNNLSSLDVSKNVKLTRLLCTVNNLNSLDVSKNVQLRELLCDNNKLNNLDVSKNVNLERLSCGNNKLNNLDVSKNVKLKRLFCYQNTLSSLEVSQNENLQELSCDRNTLSSLDVSKNEKLKQLSCGNNKLNNLDVSKNVQLSQLYCDGNNLSSLDVSKNENLEWLDCSENKLSSLDVSINENLRFFSCGNNSYAIKPEADHTFDLRKLPGSFDVSKCWHWTGGTVSGMILTLDKNAEEVTYDYVCGEGRIVSFKLVVVSCNHSYGKDWKFDQNTHWHECECGSKKDKAKHNSAKVLEAVKAGCTTPGKTEGKVCSVCGKVMVEQKDIPATGHTDANQDGKCDTCGVNVAVSEAVHTDANQDGKCDICGEYMALIKGNVYRDSSGKAFYKVITTGTTGGNVEYVKPVNKNSKTVIIPDTVKIGGGTYKVTAIAKNAFKKNKKLTKVTIGNNVATIGANAFYGCIKLKTVKMGKNVTVIGDKAFYKCTSLTKITIPSKVTKIGKYAFYGCKKLKTITIKTKKLTNKRVGSKAFKGIHSKATIKVPKSKLKSYKKLLKQKGIGKEVQVKK